MTVGELQKQLEGIDPKTRVIVNHETPEGMALFEIDHVGVAKGDPRRDPDTRKAGFKFDRNGPAEWLFVNIEHA